jgi:DNA-binding GntR family transcriptional regulator
VITTLGRKAYDELRQMLVQGRLEPGTQLVNRKLAEEIGVSMTPIREAVTRLASEGLVEYVPGAGAFVRRISRQELAELYDVREALEPVAASHAAEHATAAEIAELRAIADDSFRLIRAIAESADGHANIHQMTEWLENDRHFHEVVFQASRNRWLSKIAADMKLLAFGFSPLSRVPKLVTASAAVLTWRSHRRLIRALANRDAAAAATIIQEHVRAGKRAVLARLEATGGTRPSADTTAPRRSRRTLLHEGP